MDEAPSVFVISGPIAAGKSTVARRLAERFASGVHLEGDVFRRSIVTGREEMTPDASPEALEQLRLRYRLAAAAADEYVEAGFSVALEDVVAGPFLSELRTMIRSRPCHVVVLFPSPEALAVREAARQAKGYTSWTIAQLHEGFGRTTPRVGIWLDSSALTPDETVDAILARTPAGHGRVVVNDYDTAWPELFESIAEPVRRALSGLRAEVEHVGSTAVPRLAAKPVIDVDVVVDEREDVPETIERLRGLGYVYQGDKGVPGREAFMWPSGAPPHHLYVVVAGSEPHADHLQLRDYLRSHPHVADEYAALKRALADRYADDRAGYTAAKGEFIEATLAAARR